MRSSLTSRVLPSARALSFGLRSRRGSRFGSRIASEASASAASSESSRGGRGRRSAFSSRPRRPRSRFGRSRSEDDRSEDESEDERLARLGGEHLPKTSHGRDHPDDHERRRRAAATDGNRFRERSARSPDRGPDLERPPRPRRDRSAEADRLARLVGRCITARFIAVSSRRRITAGGRARLHLAGASFEDRTEDPAQQSRLQAAPASAVCDGLGGGGAVVASPFPGGRTVRSGSG